MTPEKNAYQPSSPNESAGILKEVEKKQLEATIVSEIKSLGKKFTKKEISSLLTQVEAAKSVESLRASLTQKENSILSDRVIQDLIKIADRIRTLTHADIEKLRSGISQDIYDGGWEMKKQVFLSERFSFLSNLESELGKNILKDSLGIAVGLVDSVALVIRVLFELIKDFVLLPRDIYESLSLSYSSESTTGRKK